MSPGPTFERVYLALKEMIVSGTFPPGAQLEPAALSATLIASITPVRDALHRLVGERLVHTPRNDGFRIPIVTEMGLRDLYRWNTRLLLAALAAPEAPHRGSDRGDQDQPIDCQSSAATARLFLDIASLSRSHEHAAAVANLNDRLNAIRDKEAVLFSDIANELSSLRLTLLSHEFPKLRRLVTAYHRRRERSAPQLLELLQPEP